MKESFLSKVRGIPAYQRNRKALAEAAERERISTRWFTEYKNNRGLYICGEDMAQPHAELTNGLHTGTVFNSMMLIRRPKLVEEATADLLRLLRLTGEVSLESIDWVVGPAMGGMTPAHALARQIEQGRSRPCFFSYAEKQSEGAVMVFNTIDPDPNERAIVFEDVITTGGTVERVIQALVQKGLIVLPNIFCWVNRSGRTSIDGKRIVALTTQPVSHWSKEGCVLCARGSKALRKPKHIENWKALNMEYPPSAADVVPDGTP
jgi:orotate phosphoribosyltransferase